MSALNDSTVGSLNFTSLGNTENWCSAAEMLMEHYIVGRKIGSGSFGEVRLAKKKSNDEIFVVKLENVYCSNLIREFNTYLKLGSVQGPQQTEFPKHVLRVFELTKCGEEYDALVMDVMGLSLQDKLLECNGAILLKTVLLIAKQILESVQYVHSRNIVHNDIKPGNFVIGRRSIGTENIIYLIDFGLAEELVHVETNEHVLFKKNRPRGTAEFMSLNVHKRCRSSRRDDLESVLYTLLYLLRGSFDWLYSPENSESLVQMKDQPAMNICKDFPLEFGTYLSYVRGLKFSESPDYEYLKKLFQKLFDQKNYVDDSVLDWTAKNLDKVSK